MLDNKFCGPFVARNKTVATRPNVVAKKLSQNKMPLEEIGIMLEQLRTGSRRTLILKHVPPVRDDNYDNDSKMDSDPVSDLSSSRV